MSKIFISYRRDDSAGYAHAIYRELVQHFPKDRLFMDVDTVEPGVDFVRVIEEAVGECDVFLALIGKRWANVGSGAGSRLDDPEDFVRLEISTALARDIRVIPVLVDGMTMPGAETLPNVLKPLSRRNAMEISNTRFNFDLERVTTAVRKILDETEIKRKAEEEAERYSLVQEAQLRALEAKAPRTAAEEEYLRELQRQRFEEEAERKADEDKRKRIEEEKKYTEQETGQRRVKRQVTMQSLSELLEQREGRLEPGTVFRDKLKDGSQGPEMVVIPAGTFRMGDFQGDCGESERPGHTVRIREPFAIGR